MTAPVKFGALVNPQSRQNRKRPPDLASLKAGGAVVEMTGDVPEARAAIRRMAAAEVSVLAVSGGDGAVLTALTAILAEDAFPAPPILCLVPGGTTNMTAADIGLPPGRDGLRQAMALAASGQGRIQTRQTVRLDGARDETGAVHPHVGMFFGAIGICRAIAFCRKHLHSRGVVGGAASWLTLAPLLLKNVISDDPEGVLAGAPATVRTLDADAGETLEGPFAVIMASTLAKLALGARPFWGEGDGLPLTVTAAPPPRLLRNIGPLLFGKTQRPAAPGYISRAAVGYEIDYAGTVTLDGELYEAEAGRPIRVTHGGPVRFLTP